MAVCSSSLHCVHRYSSTSHMLKSKCMMSLALCTWQGKGCHSCKASKVGTKHCRWVVLGSISVLANSETELWLLLPLLLLQVHLAVASPSRCVCWLIQWALISQSGKHRCPPSGRITSTRSAVCGITHSRFVW